MQKLLGCNKDHSKEIDLYDKTYSEKIDRVNTMAQQAKSALEEAQRVAAGVEEETIEQGEERKTEHLQKASYYYQQALLVFYYLIPDTDEETEESERLKFECFLGQTKVYHLQKKYLDALNEITQATTESRHHGWHGLKSEFLYTRARVQLDLQKYEEAKVTCTELESEERVTVLLKEIKEAKAEHERQEKELYKKMIDSKKDKNKKKS